VEWVTCTSNVETRPQVFGIGHTGGVVRARPGGLRARGPRAIHFVLNQARRE